MWVSISLLTLRF